MPRPLPDLVRDSKIETTALSDKRTRHVTFRAGRSARQRQVRIEETWVRDGCLGRGAYGTVYKEYKETRDASVALLGEIGDESKAKVRAVKKINKSVIAGEEIDYTMELEAVAKFSLPKYSHCFVRSDGWYEIDDAIYIIIEYLEYGDLQRQVKSPLPEPEARDIASQVLEGLEHMHENGFVHRDLKPGNIMVVQTGPDWWVKIADFGISKRRQQDVTTLRTLQRGTFGFAAPEALGLRGGASYTSAVDLWSLGAVVFWLFTQAAVFPNFIDFCSYCSGTRGFPADILEAQGISRDGQDFIRSLMLLDAKDRPSANAATTHPWVTRPLAETADAAAPVTTSSGSSRTSTSLSAATTTSDASAAWSEASESLLSRSRGQTIRPREQICYRAPYIEEENEKETEEPDEEVDREEASSILDDDDSASNAPERTQRQTAADTNEDDWRTCPIVFYHKPASQDIATPVNPGMDVVRRLQDAYSRRYQFLERFELLEKLRVNAGENFESAWLKNDIEEVRAYLRATDDEIELLEEENPKAKGYLAPSVPSPPPPEPSFAPQKPDELDWDALSRRFLPKPPLRGPSSTAATVGSSREYDIENEKKPAVRNKKSRAQQERLAREERRAEAGRSRSSRHPPIS